MRIKIEQYQQAADEKVSLGGIKWLNKWDVCVQCDSREEAEALKARLAEPEQEPVAWDLADKVRRDLDRQSCPDAFMRIAVEAIVKHYTAPPQRKWQGLTTAERKVLWTLTKKPSEYAELIEAKLKGKNHE